MELRISTVKKLSLLLIPAALLIISTGCSSSNQGTSTDSDLNGRSDQTFSFYKDEDGRNVRWEVNFDNGRISSLYKDGQRLPDAEIGDYEDMIYHRLDRLHNESHSISIDLDGFHSDMGRFKQDMQKLKKEMKDQKFEFNFDGEEFREGMKQLSKELSKLKHKKIRIDFDSDKFREEMEQLKKNIDVHVDVNMEEMDKSLEQMNEEMDKHGENISHISIDLTGLDEAMAHLDENLANIKINLKGIDVKIKKLNEFIDKIKAEMVKDNLLKTTDEELNLDLHKDGMSVNGKEVPPELFEKYKKMYEEHFDKELSEDNNFRIID